jgi:hypothetical protein
VGNVVGDSGDKAATAAAPFDGSHGLIRTGDKGLGDAKTWGVPRYVTQRCYPFFLEKSKYINMLMAYAFSSSFPRGDAKRFR